MPEVHTCVQAHTTVRVQAHVKVYTMHEGMQVDLSAQSHMGIPTHNVTHDYTQWPGLGWGPVRVGAHMGPILFENH